MCNVKINEDREWGALVSFLWNNTEHKEALSMHNFVKDTLGCCAVWDGDFFSINLILFECRDVARWKCQVFKHTIVTNIHFEQIWTKNVGTPLQKIMLTFSHDNFFPLNTTLCFSFHKFPNQLWKFSLFLPTAHTKTFSSSFWQPQISHTYTRKVTYGKYNDNFPYFFSLAQSWTK
jgi:hypothetical protein